MYRWVEHTGELELEITGESAEAVFAEATVATGEILAESPSAVGAPGKRTLEVQAPDLAALLAAFIEELVFLAESESLVPIALRRVELEDRRARAEVILAPGDPPHLVKAVTYHRLEFAPADAGYRARVVLDV